MVFFSLLLRFGLPDYCIYDTHTHTPAHTLWQRWIPTRTRDPAMAISFPFSHQAGELALRKQMHTSTQTRKVSHTRKVQQARWTRRRPSLEQAAWFQNVHILL